MKESLGSSFLQGEECPYCASTDLCEVIAVNRGGHYGKIVCNRCDRFIKWIPKPKAEKAQDPRAEVSKTLVNQYSKGFCEICLRKDQQLPKPQTLEGHHIVQVKDGGTDDKENIQIVCTFCHRWIHSQRTYLGHYASGSPVRYVDGGAA
jgi:hypothetical protein